MKSFTWILISFLSTSMIVACGKTDSKRANLNRSANAGKVQAAKSDLGAEDKSGNADEEKPQAKDIEQQTSSTTELHDKACANSIEMKAGLDEVESQLAQLIGTSGHYQLSEINFYFSSQELDSKIQKNFSIKSSGYNPMPLNINADSKEVKAIESNLELLCHNLEKGDVTKLENIFVQFPNSFDLSTGSYLVDRKDTMTVTQDVFSSETVFTSVEANLIDLEKILLTENSDQWIVSKNSKSDDIKMRLAKVVKDEDSKKNEFLSYWVEATYKRKKDSEIIEATSGEAVSAEPADKPSEDKASDEKSEDILQTEA